MLWFELSIIFIFLVISYYLYYQDKKYLWVIFATIIGIFMFEYITQALWLNLGLSKWTYIYLDVNWVITLGWASIILGSKIVIEKLFPKISEAKHFVYHLILTCIVGLFAELLVRFLGIREYTPVVLDRLVGIYIFGLVPIEAFYYIPTFMLLVLAFSRYHELTLDSKKGGKR